MGGERRKLPNRPSCATRREMQVYRMRCKIEVTPMSFQHLH